MRLLESLMFILNIIVIVLLISGWIRKIKGAIYIPFLTFVVMIIHIVVEKVRWQMYPLYLVTLLFLVVAILYRISSQKSKHVIIRPRIRRLLIGLMGAFIVISGGLVYSFPVYKMTVPDGKYKIGTQSFDIMDPERSAIYSDNLDNNRKIKIQIWYPAETVEGYNRVPWIEDGTIVARALAQDMNLPFFALDQTALVKSNSYEEAPISNELDKYPVVVISHGWTGFRDIHAEVAEELASNGYIVVGIDHTYGSEITVFNDGEIAYLNREALPDSDVTPNFMEYANTLVTTYGGDVNLTINELEKFNAGEGSSTFAGKMDLTQIGLLGHSTGGGGDVSLALEDKRIKAVVGMDAWVEPIDTSEIEKGLKIPALFLRSGQWEVGPNNENLLNLIDKSTGPISLYQINDTVHLDFSMVYMYSPLTKLMNLTGKLDGRISSSIQKDLIHNFFDEYLKNDTSIDINDVANQWSEVTKVK